MVPVPNSLRRFSPRAGGAAGLREVDFLTHAGTHRHAVASKTSGEFLPRFISARREVTKPRALVEWYLGHSPALWIAPPALCRKTAGMPSAWGARSCQSA